jgi:hypothetical protein
VSDDFNEKCPAGLRLTASLAGGIIGALNPMVQSFRPSGYKPWVGMTGSVGEHFAAATWFMAFVLLVPCIMATFMAYPWLYRRIRSALRANRKPRRIAWGFQFGLMASFLAAFLLSLELLLFNMVTGRTTTWYEALLMVGGGTAGFSFLALFYIPVLLISGAVYAAINYAIIAAGRAAR